MGILVPDEFITIYKSTLTAMREDLGRFVTLHIPGKKTRCPNCLFDPVNKRSSNVYSPRNPYPAGISGPQEFKNTTCPICNGTGNVTTETTKSVKCLIRTLKKGEKDMEIYGQEDENFYQVKADIKYFNDFKNARIVEIDGVPTEVQRLAKRGLRDLVQVVAWCKISEWGPGKKTDVSRY